MKLLESGEMYLETILILSKKSAQVRSVDIAAYTGFSKPSVSRAVGLLKDGGYIEVGADGFISLTELGLELAEKIYDRHETLTEFFKSLGVPEEIAAEDACKIEHNISDVTFEALKRHKEGL